MERRIEIDVLGRPVGKQDQFIAAYGGVTCFEFNRDDSVLVKAAAISHEVLDNLEDGLCLFFTGYTRSAAAILKDQEMELRQEQINSLMDEVYRNYPLKEVLDAMVPVYQKHLSRGDIANIEAQVRSLVEAWEWTAEDRILHFLPLHHIHGIINVLSCALWSGACCRKLK